MKSAPKHPHENERLKSLEALNILESLPESDFDQITQIASEICGTPIALISLVDKDRQWFKAKLGIDVSETNRNIAFCAHAILQNDVFVVEDPSKDERFFDNPLVKDDPKIQFYAGAPLYSPDGYPIGTVCVIDRRPRKLTAGQSQSLKGLSNQVTRLLDLNYQLDKVRQTEEQINIRNIAMEIISEGVIIRNSKGELVDANPAALDILGVKREDMFREIPNRSNWTAVREDGSPLPPDQHPGDIALRTKKSVKNTLLGVTTPASIQLWLQVSAEPIFEKTSKELIGVVISFADITTQIQIQRDAIKKKNELRFILDSIPHMIGFWSSGLINLNSNAVYANYFKKHPPDIKGKHIKDLLGEEIYEENLPYIQKVLSGETVTFERSLPHVDGTVHHTLATYVPNIQLGVVQSFLAIVMDITNLKNLETERQALESKLAETARLSALGEMAGGVAHEVNNPLAIIVLKIEMMKQLMTEDKLEKSFGLKELAVIESTVDRIAKIVKGLRIYSRNAEKDPFQMTSIVSIINDTLALCGEKFKANSINIKILAVKDMEIQCRPAQISQILMNLLMNSYDALISLSEKWIEISVIDSDQSAIIIIKDSGHGIDSSVANKIMQPFFTTKDIGQGTGLGLSISLGIAETHGGKLIYVPSEKNTTFSLTLPKTQSKNTKDII